jgi:hypothetical protein
MTRTSEPFDALSSVTELPAEFATQTWVPLTATLAGPLKSPTLADADKAVGAPSDNIA